MSLADLKERTEYYRLKAQRQGRAHHLSAKRSRWLNTWLGVPVVAATAIVGTTIFTTLSSQPTLWLRVTTGVLSIGAAVLSALQTFFRFSERTEKHAQAAASLHVLERKLDLFQLRLARAEESDSANLLDQLASLAEEFGKVEKDRSDVPDELYYQAWREQRGSKEGT